ncbi:MAG: hypothetical protein ACRC1K_05135 [Planctomycetia bacterium]
MRRFDRRPIGYTLLEMLLTLGLVVLLTAIVWPALESLAVGGPLERAVDRCRGTFQSVRLRAMDENVPHQLTVTLGGPSFAITKGVAATNPAGQIGGAASDESVVETNDGVLGEHELPAGLTFVASDLAPVGETAVVTFLPEGTSNDVQFTIRDAQGGEVAFEWRGTTGRMLVGPPRSAGAAPAGGGVAR